jgi:hypothetical protein
MRVQFSNLSFFAGAAPKEIDFLKQTKPGYIYHHDGGPGKETTIKSTDIYKKMETADINTEVRDVYEVVKGGWRHRQFVGRKKVLEETGEL